MWFLTFIYPGEQKRGTIYGVLIILSTAKFLRAAFRSPSLDSGPPGVLNKGTWTLRTERTDLLTPLLTSLEPHPEFSRCAPVPSPRAPPSCAPRALLLLVIPSSQPPRPLPPFGLPPRSFFRNNPNPPFPRPSCTSPDVPFVIPSPRASSHIHPAVTWTSLTRLEELSGGRP